MEKESVIQLRGLSKKFCKNIGLSMRFALSDVAQNFWGLPLRKNELREKEFWALKDVSFKVNREDAVAIIGGNGAGKSTLLQVIQGIYEPDEGEVETHGTITALAKLSTSFHSDYTGYENIWVYATVLGLKPKEIRKRMDAILAFADIGEFIDSPIKYYSRGMTMRLASAVAMHCSADTLLIDEAMTVGDMQFVEKCKKRIQELIADGSSILFVSHNMPLVKAICSKAIWLHRGRLKAAGSVAEICPLYEHSQMSQSE